MNKEFIERLAKLIENEPHGEDYFAEEGFGMSQYFHECGSPSCVGGYALYLGARECRSSTKELKESFDFTTTRDRAAKFMGIDQDLAGDLFLPESGSWAYDATPRQAAFLLRNLIATGKVDWDLAMSQEA